MKSPQPHQRPPKPPSPQEKMAAAQADADKWTQVAANPNLSPRAAAWAQNMARSAKAEVQLRQKDLAYQGENPPQESSGDPYLDRLLGLNSSPQGQPPPSSPENPST